MTHSRTPDLMPVLSRGKHRSPRKGACFMELASYLAGERWSDHPPCTHPLLAALARSVNDHVSDASRSRLAPLIPEVIGLTGDDPRVDAWIAEKVALTALPVVAAERQGVAAVALMRCERVLNELEGRPLDQLSPQVREALDRVPHARDWARSFSVIGWGRMSAFRKRSAPAIVHAGVAALASAPVADPDSLLVDLLTDTIAACREWMPQPRVEVADDEWAAVVRLTRR